MNQIASKFWFHCTAITAASTYKFTSFGQYLTEARLSADAQMAIFKFELSSRNFTIVYFAKHAEKLDSQ